jgi:hypothetical protein
MAGRHRDQRRPPRHRKPWPAAARRSQRIGELGCGTSRQRKGRLNLGSLLRLAHHRTRARGVRLSLVVLELFATPGNHLRRSQANVLLVLHVFVMLRSCYR